MADQFYVGRGSKRFGPFSAGQLRQLAAAGQFQPQDTIWREGLESPVLAVKVRNLFPPPRPARPSDTHVDLPAVPPVSEASPQAPAPESLAPAAPPVTPPEVVEAKAPAPVPEPARKRRAVAVKGAVIISQDGTYANYRKKCSQCGHEDACRSSMLIGNGATRAQFFCPKCRKSREVQINGMIQ
jgi:hypothetical protein